jgi:hypothetical protein
MQELLQFEMPDVTHHSFNLGRRFGGTLLHEGSGDIPPSSRHLVRKSIQLFIDLLGGGEGMRGIALIACEYETSYLGEVLMVEVFG